MPIESSGFNKSWRQKMFQPPLRGLIAAAVTPLKEDCSVDFDGIGPMTDRLLERGVSGLYVCGSTGEGMSLSTDERKAVTESYVQAVNGRATVIVQAGHNSLVEACELARHAEQVGADVLSATCPSYFKNFNCQRVARLHVASLGCSTIATVLLLPHPDTHRIPCQYRRVP